MKVAEQQAKNAGFYHFDRSLQDDIKIVGKLNDICIDMLKLYLNDQLTNKHTYDIKYNEIYLRGQNTPNQTESQLEELRNTYQALKNAGYPDDYISFMCSNVDKQYPLDKKIGEQFPFKSYNTRFSILPPHSVSIYHLDHNFITDDNGNKIYQGGFYKDYGCRKFLIALDDRTVGNAFYFGNAAWDWKKGDIVLLDNAIPHYGANFSQNTRAFFMITGVIDDRYQKFINQWNFVC
jgi:hypothetical protein